MTSVFGRGLRGRKKAAEAGEEVAQIANEANLWWTRRDFVQHAVVRTRRPAAAVGANTPADDLTAPAADAPGWGPPPDTAGTPAAGPARGGRAGTPPTAPPGSRERAGPDPLAGRSFAEVFTTESLFAEPPAPRAAGRATSTSTVTATAPVTAPAQPAPEPPRARRRPLAANHPLVEPLEQLGLGREATWADIQLAYRTKAKLAHPDVTGDDGERMALLNAAYNALRDGRSYGLFDGD
jgi:hypothetical protein